MFIAYSQSLQSRVFLLVKISPVIVVGGWYVQKHKLASLSFCSLFSFICINSLYSLCCLLSLYLFSVFGWSFVYYSMLISPSVSIFCLYCLFHSLLVVSISVFACCCFLFYSIFFGSTFLSSFSLSFVGTHQCFNKHDLLTQC